MECDYFIIDSDPSAQHDHEYATADRMVSNIYSNHYRID
jgi:hypothetical protein